MWALFVFSFLLIQNKGFSTNPSELFEIDSEKSTSQKQEPLENPLERVVKVADSVNCSQSTQLERKLQSISFSGGSYFSVTYCLGVLDVLQKFFDLSNVVYLGDSSGSLVTPSIMVPENRTRNRF